MRYYGSKISHPRHNSMKLCKQTINLKQLNSSPLFHTPPVGTLCWFSSHVYTPHECGCFSTSLHVTWHLTLNFRLLVSSQNKKEIQTDQSNASYTKDDEFDWSVWFFIFPWSSGQATCCTFCTLNGTITTCVRAWTMDKSDLLETRWQNESSVTTWFVTDEDHCG